MSQDQSLNLSKNTSLIKDDVGVNEFEEDTEQIWKSMIKQNSTNKKDNNNNRKVLLEGYVNKEEDDLKRAKSLTDEDLDELKGCVDLGFGFNYDEIPELCNTLPALELCYSMSQMFVDNNNNDKNNMVSDELVVSDLAPASGSVANWKFSSPGDHPEDVKARLKFWAQAVACTVKLCN